MKKLEKGKVMFIPTETNKNFTVGKGVILDESDAKKLVSKKLGLIKKAKDKK
jgi:hypothetical protein